MIKLIRFVGLIIAVNLDRVFTRLRPRGVSSRAQRSAIFRLPSWLVPDRRHYLSESSPTNLLTRPKSSLFSNRRRPPMSAAASW